MHGDDASGQADKAGQLFIPDLVPLIQSQRMVQSCSPKVIGTNGCNT
jgi:hypothetical protein